MSDEVEESEVSDSMRIAETDMEDAIPEESAVIIGGPDEDDFPNVGANIQVEILSGAKFANFVLLKIILFWSFLNKKDWLE